MVASIALPKNGTIARTPETIDSPIQEKNDQIASSVVLRSDVTLSDSSSTRKAQPTPYQSESCNCDA